MLFCKLLIYVLLYCFEEINKNKNKKKIYDTFYSYFEGNDLFYPTFVKVILACLNCCP